MTVEELSSIILLVRMQSRWWRRENFDGAAAGGEQRAAQQLLSAGGGAVKIFSAPPELLCPGQSDDARQLFRRHRGHLSNRVLRYGPVTAEATFSSCSLASGRDVGFLHLLQFWVYFRHFGFTLQNDSERPGPKNRRSAAHREKAFALCKAVDPAAGQTVRRWTHQGMRLNVWHQTHISMWPCPLCLAARPLQVRLARSSLQGDYQP